MYGIAFDLGTTSIVGYLCDLGLGQIISTLIVPNPQIRYGLDVLSRVSFMNDTPDGKNILSKALSETMADIMGVFSSNITDSQSSGITSPLPKYERMVIVANPIVMSTISSCSFDEFAKEIIRLPAIGGYVGADALSASYMVNCSRKSSSYDLMVDIGTNTEIVLITPDRLFATSAAAGPALEGGNIVCGMSASDGACDRFSLTYGVNSNSDIVFHTIDEDNSGIFPVGICGSGMLSLIDILLKCGAIDRTGYLYSQKEALAKNLPPKIASRINDGQDGRYIRITDEILVFQEDIRAIQLAVSAIRSGIEILLSKADLTTEVNLNIYLAGAFGNKMNVDNALNLGLLPHSPSINIMQAGNLAGLGAVSMVLNPDQIHEATKFKENIRMIQLANEVEFQNCFIKYMSFPVA